MFLIVGLGNPGKKYSKTRHNVGFMVVDNLVKDMGITTLQGKHKALFAQTTLYDHKILLAEPQTFMNLSGESVSEIASWYKIATDHIVVVYDDVDLEPGSIRIREKGSSGGHKGMESIISHVRSMDFPRVRIGIGKDSSIETADYVLSKFTKEELILIDDAISSASDAIKCIIAEGTSAAMNKYNS